MARSEQPADALESGGWAGRSPTAPLAAAEQAVRRRWVLLGGVGVLLTAGHVVGVTAGSPAAIATVIVASAFLNLIASSLLSTGRLAGAQIFLAVVLDAVVSGTVVLFFGPGTVGAVLLIAAAMPYGGTSPAVRVTSVGASAAVYVLAGLVWFAVAAEPARVLADAPLALWLDAAVLTTVLLVLFGLSVRLNRRLRQVRQVLEAAAGGAVGERAQVDGTDEASGLADAGNDLIERLVRLVVEASDAADRLRRGAMVLDERMDRAREADRQAAGAADGLGDGLWGQRAAVEDAVRDADAAVQEVATLRANAEEAESSTRHMEAVAARGRDAAVRSHESAMAVAQSFRAASTAMSEFAGLSDRVDALATILPRIARTTRLLALNAGIEAARAEGHGAGFNAIADEVRDLARATGDLARSATDLKSVLRHSTDGLLRAMQTAELEVADLSEAASEACSALSGLPAAAAAAGDLAAAATRVSESQLGRLTALAERRGRSAEAAARHARTLEEGRKTTADQVVVLESLAAVAEEVHLTSQDLTAAVAPYQLASPPSRPSGPSSERS